jgi:hypothetical protein
MKQCDLITCYIFGFQAFSVLLVRSSQTEVQKRPCGSNRSPDLQNAKIYSWVLVSDSVLLTENSRKEPFCEIWEYIKHGSKR